MNKKQILSLILSLIMMLTIAFPVGVLADGEEGEPVEQEPIVLVEEEKDGNEQEPVQEETPEQPAADGEPEAEAPKGTITITTQPTSKTATAGEKVTLSVVATGTGLTYQWQRKSKTADDTAWGNASGEAAKKANWELTVVAAHFDLDFRCLITDGSGTTKTTNTVNINKPAIIITTQPTSKTAATGTKVTLSVAATGTGLTYQWQRKSKTATSWGNASGDAAKKANWELTVVAAHYDLDFRCLITDANGKTATTNTVNINKPDAITITTQPTSKTAAAGEKVTLSVAATGTGLTYQWQRKSKTATSWGNASGEAAKKANWELTVVAAHFDLDFRCLITDADGNTKTTNTVNINKPAIIITTQPTSKTAATGTKVTLSVAATGTGLTYQWQRKSKTATSWGNASGDAAKKANWELTVVAAHYDLDFRCLITDANGKTATTNTVNINKPAITITAQPTSKTAATGTKVTLSVAATGTGLTYQWQRKSKTATEWGNASGDAAKSANWELTVVAAHYNLDFRCLITDADGNTKATNTVNINKPAITITKQPTDQTVAIGSKALLSVAATGTGLTYQWQYKNKTATTWNNHPTAKSANWELTVAASHYNFDFQCVITDADGNFVISNKVNVLQPAITITTQPTSKTAAAGEKVTLSVAATGTGLTYQWQRKSKTATEWGNASGDAAKSANWELTVVATHYSLDFRCLITDASGATVTSNTVNINKPAITITKQPTDQTVAIGSKALLSVAATGTGLTYQWQYKNKTATTWNNHPTAKSANWELTVAASHYNFDFQCVITDADGNFVISNKVNVLQPAITITTQPTSQAALVGAKVTLSVAATGTGLTYQWQRKSKTADDTAWGNASGDAAKSASWQLTVVAAHYNLDFRCLITDANGNTETTNVVNIDPIAITTQPTDKIAAVGDKVTLSVVASGTGLTYQWQRKSKTATEWGNASGDAAKKASWQLTVVAAHYNLDFRCLITDANGYTVVTDTVNIYDMSHAEPFTVSGVTYLALSASTCKVVSYSGTASSLTIPGTAKGLTVVEIGEEAFMGNTTLTSIDLPDSITVIRARAFKGCTNLSDMH